MNWLINALTKLGLLNEDLDYPVIRASMVILFVFFGYQKWFEYEAQVPTPCIGNGPLLFWMYPAFEVRRASWVLGASEWSFARVSCSVPQTELVHDAAGLKVTQ